MPWLASALERRALGGAAAVITVCGTLTDGVRAQDTPVLLQQLLSSPGSRDATWEYIKSHWTAVTSKVGGFLGMPAVAGALGGYCSAEKSADIKAFFAKNPVPPAARLLQQSIERIESCVALDQRQSAPFTRWLGAQR